MPGQKAPEEARREQILSAAFEVALRTGIDGVTLRAVATEAELSHGLVVFYFKQKDQLIGALLDRVLATTAMTRASDETGADDADDDARATTAAAAAPPDRLGALVRQQLTRLAHEPRGVRLFFEYWALGVRHAAIRHKIAAALERYRAAFRTMAEEMLAAAGPRRADDGLTPDALAAVAVSLINGCAVQMMIDPERFDTEAYVAAAQALVARLVPPPATTARVAGARRSRSAGR